MPFKTEHSARVKDPSLFVKDSFRRKNISIGIDIIVGKLKSKPTGGMVVQSYRFDASKFTSQEAKDWMKQKGEKYILFEKAEPKKASSAEETKVEIKEPKLEDFTKIKEDLLTSIFGKNRLVKNTKPKPIGGRWFEKEYIKEKEKKEE